MKEGGGGGGKEGDGRRVNQLPEMGNSRHQVLPGLPSRDVSQCPEFAAPVHSSMANITHTPTECDPTLEKATRRVELTKVLMCCRTDGSKLSQACWYCRRISGFLEVR